jgi:CheY-like chemotaxis protein
MKILAVDDDSFILEILTMTADAAGFTDVSTALSADIALDMLNQSDVVYDCLLLDINMPGMDGIELCQMVRAMPAYSQAPIIMLTAMADRDYIDRAFKAGATDYATKPFELTELTSRLGIAEELVIARRTAPPTPKVIVEAPQTTNQHEFDLSAAIHIKGINDFIQYTAFVNYLKQLSRSGVSCSQILAIKIGQIEDIYARASSEEFLYALTEVADATGNILGARGYMMTYAGNGTFLVVSNKVTLEASFGLESEIQSLLDDQNTEYDNGDPLDINVYIGNPIRPHPSKTQRIRKTVDRAIARAESRYEKKINEARPMSISLAR